MSGRKMTKPPGARRIGPEARAAAMVLLAEGFSLTAVGAELKVKRQTVVKWRDSVDGQRQLAAARASRTELLKGAADRARAILESGAQQAADALVELVTHGAPKDRMRAASLLLDRVGVPRTERVETLAVSIEDLSQLDDDELAELERLRSKAKRA